MWKISVQQKLKSLERYFWNKSREEPAKEEYTIKANEGSGRESYVAKVGKKPEIETSAIKAWKKPENQEHTNSRKVRQLSNKSWAGKSGN